MTEFQRHVLAWIVAILGALSMTTAKHVFGWPMWVLVLGGLGLGIAMGAAGLYVPSIAAPPPRHPVLPSRAQKEAPPAANGG